jgi:hypothetical protein
MPDIVFLQAYVDFVSLLPLTDIACRIAKTCFGGIDFVGENEGIWDEVPALRLERRVLGLEVILGGRPGKEGGYTLQVSSRDPLGGALPVDPEGSKAAICDFSIYLTALVQQIPGVEMSAD